MGTGVESVGGMGGVRPARCLFSDAFPLYQPSSGPRCISSIYGIRWISNLGVTSTFLTWTRSFLRL